MVETIYKAMQSAAKLNLITVQQLQCMPVYKGINRINLFLLRPLQ